MIAFVAMWLAGGAVIAALAGAAVFLGEKVSAPLKRLIAAANEWDAKITAAAIVVAGVAWWFILNVVLFGPFHSALLELWGNPSTTADLTILSSMNRSVHTNHYLVSAYSRMVIALIVWRWFPAMERRTPASSAIRLWKFGALAVAFAFVATAAAPRRLVLERFPIVEFDGRPGLVIGSAGNELLLYAPNEPGRPRRRVRSDATSLQRTGETSFLFDPVAK